MVWPLLIEEGSKRPLLFVLTYKLITDEKGRADYISD